MFRRCFYKNIAPRFFDDVLKKHNIVLAMYIIDDYFGTISRSTMEPKSTLKVQVHPMQQVFQSKYEFEDPLPNSHWGETTELYIVSQEHLVWSFDLVHR